MTATETEPMPTTDTWNQQLEQLRARYKHVRDPILVALNILVHDQNISLDDAKAQAALHGVRITAASVSAAQRILSRQDGSPATAPEASRTTSQPPARARRAAKADRSIDIENVVREAVTRISAKSATDAERLRAAMRKAIDVLATAVDA